MNKPILCLDFDGVIHSYTSGWQGAATVSDPPVEGAIAFLREALKVFDVQIYSSRSHEPGGQRAMREWLGYHVLDQRLAGDEDLAWVSEIGWPNHKPSAMVTIDDRALTFDGTWPDIAALKAFKPWNKK
jgi:hypothetical protein